MHSILERATDQSSVSFKKLQGFQAVDQNYKKGLENNLQLDNRKTVILANGIVGPPSIDRKLPDDSSQ